MSDDIEYLYGLVSGVNTPFNSITTTVDLRDNNNQWLLRHAYQYLHHKARVTSNDNNDYNIFITRGAWDIRIFVDNEPRSNPYTYEGYIDLEDVTTWVIGLTPGSGDENVYQGAWGAGQYTKYDIVLHESHYWYAEITTNEEPTGVPADWQDLGTDVNIWTVGTRYQMYVYTNENLFTFTIDYLLESDQTSL
ncbi:hypothetical protein LCGC14_0387290 [marine sediment metagenome]|uniref:Uncharacterized protein n=1 Tax=marine sediment metagenome TaxID=412755 RepID=A0A0F9VMZ8_9ZZZZ